MGDLQGSSVQGVNYPGRRLTRCNYLGAILLDENCPGSNYLRWEFSGEFSGCNCPRWQLSGGQLCRGNCPVPFLKYSLLIQLPKYILLNYRLIVNQ